MNPVRCRVLKPCLISGVIRQAGEEVAVGHLEAFPLERTGFVEVIEANAELEALREEVANARVQVALEHNPIFGPSGIVQANKRKHLLSVNRSV